MIPNMSILMHLPLVSTIPAANFSTIFASVFDTGGKFATGVNDTGGKFFHHFRYSVVDTGGKFATGVNDTGGKFSTGVNDAGGKLQIYLYANSTTQSCQKKIIKIFLIEDFFDLPPVFLQPVANLELQISPRIFEKI
jgi:hypothetical protein